MQELIDYLQIKVDSYPEDCVKNIVPRDVLNGMHHSNCNALVIAKKAIEKEKEQIFEFADRYVDDVMGGCVLRANEYFEKHYKQNK